MSAVKDRKLTVDVLRRLLDYNQETGVFRWRYDMRRVPMDGIAGRKSTDGYVRIGINGEQVLAHRLAWFYVNGKWPKGDVDHINRIRNDNRIFNLRDATRSQNIHYSRPKWSNKSGFKGVHWAKTQGKWIAQIKINQRGIHLGQFGSAEAASEAYQNAAKRYFKEFAYLPDNALPSPVQNINHPMRYPVGFSEALLYGANP